MVKIQSVALSAVNLVLAALVLMINLMLERDSMRQSMSTIKNKTAFAKQHNESRATIQMRIKSGFRFGMLNGELVMYNPSTVKKVLDTSEIEIVNDKES